MARALVTGATAGIGRAFAQRLAEAGWNLVLVARDAGRLEEAAGQLKRYAVDVEVLPADLSEDKSLATVEQRLADDTEPVDMLVNNAGFAIRRSFLSTSVDEEDRLLRVLVRAVLRLTHVGVQAMVRRGRGVVINVSSVAGFVPQSTYNAAKAYVTALTESVATELKGTSVHVLALCPGYTHTEFHERASIDKGAIPEPLWLDVERVVDGAFDDLRRGVIVSVPSLRYKVITQLSRRAPRKLVTAISSRLGRQ
ncbi:MAG: SDR family NAD(P)-dependent oxidoreductase [Streptosporangiales bacterium]|nr:SDR family NAD(P)-dependent oxidoreductase [Streptosporangiales bacterium]